MPCTDRVKRDMPKFWQQVLTPQEQVDIDMELHTEIHEILRSTYPKQDIHFIMDKMSKADFADLVGAALRNVRSNRRKRRMKMVNERLNERLEEEDDEVEVRQERERLRA